MPTKITVGGEGLSQVARDAVKAGLGWILLNREVAYIDELRAQCPSLPIAIVTIDQIGIGRIQGKQFRRLLPRGGNALYIQGPPDTSAAKDRLSGVEEILKDSTIQLKVLNAEWTEQSAERTVRLWLERSGSNVQPPDLIGAQNDAMAIGAHIAITELRPEWLNRPFTGCDGLVDGGQRLVREGKLAATVIVPPTAGAAINLLTTSLRDRTPPQARLILKPQAYPPLL